MFISRHTLKWTKTCRSSGDFPHAHTAHFLLNRHMRFQSTLPGWGATGGRRPVRHPAHISIHAPRMGSDRPPRRVVTAFRIFQSTLPGWGATNPQTLGNTLYLFQSTLPGWGATFRHPFCFPSICISIHAPRMGSDSAYSSVPAVSGTVFQSTLPGWGATVTVPPWPIVPIFQSTLPGWGATNNNSQ